MCIRDSARATMLAASKATDDERLNEGSTLRQVAERVRALLLRILDMTTASAPSLAYAFVDAMANLKLPPCFSTVVVSSMHATHDLIAARTMTHGAAAAVLSACNGCASCAPDLWSDSTQSRLRPSGCVLCDPPVPPGE